MIEPSVTEAEFDIICKCIPIELTAEKKAELYRAYGQIEEMRRLVRKPRSHTYEPAHIFAIETGGARDVG